MFASLGRVFSSDKSGSNKESVDKLQVAYFSWGDFLIGAKIDQSPSYYLGNLDIKKHKKWKNLWSFTDRKSQEKGYILDLNFLFSGRFNFSSELPLYLVSLQLPQKKIRGNVYVVFPKKFAVKPLRAKPETFDSLAVDEKKPSWNSANLFSDYYRLSATKKIFLLSIDRYLQHTLQGV